MCNGEPRGRRHALISAGAQLFLHWQCTLQWGYLCPRSWQAFDGLISCRSDRSLTSPFRSSLKCRDRNVVRILPPRQNVPSVVSHPVPYFQRLSIFDASSRATEGGECQIKFLDWWPRFISDCKRLSKSCSACFGFLQFYFSFSLFDLLSSVFLGFARLCAIL